MKKWFYNNYSLMCSDKPAKGYTPLPENALNTTLGSDVLREIAEYPTTPLKPYYKPSDIKRLLKNDYFCQESFYLSFCNGELTFSADNAEGSFSLGLDTSLKGSITQRLMVDGIAPLLTGSLVGINLYRKAPHFFIARYRNNDVVAYMPAS